MVTMALEMSNHAIKINGNNGFIPKSNIQGSGWSVGLTHPRSSCIDLTSSVGVSTSHSILTDLAPHYDVCSLQCNCYVVKLNTSGGNWVSFTALHNELQLTLSTTTTRTR